MFNNMIPNFVVAHFHIVMGVAAMFWYVAGVYNWFPKMFGRFMNDTLGKLHFWGTIIGAYSIFCLCIILGWPVSQGDIIDLTPSRHSNIFQRSTNL
jgi:heme/copper-type cytochrome/quinol oxidase subunit 1